MDVPIDLDPREVLEHLNALGYDNITKEQLKLFIKDLKKLIKHDLRKIQAQKHAEQENRPENPDPSKQEQKKNTRGTAEAQRKVLGQRNAIQMSKATAERSTKSVQTIGTYCDLGSSTPSVVSSDHCASTASQDPNPNKCSCKPASCPCLRSKSGKQASSGKKENPPPKPVSSFIRVVPSEVRMGKTDPVTLYHYYQNLWSRQNRPGENPHADVRWRIRHKMMAPTALRTNAENKRENPPWVD